MYRFRAPYTEIDFERLLADNQSAEVVLVEWNDRRDMTISVAILQPDIAREVRSYAPGRNIGTTGLKLLSYSLSVNEDGSTCFRGDKELDLLVAKDRRVGEAAREHVDTFVAWLNAERRRRASVTVTPV